MSDIPKHIRQGIQKASRCRFKEINLSSHDGMYKGYKFKHIPDEVMDMNWLEILNLDSNLIANIPDNISQLNNLVKLYLSNNQITEIPESITYLEKLSMLELSDNRITEIPNYISHLNNLIYLGLSSNKITKIPDSISQLNNLVIIDIGNNLLSEIPASIAHLQNLGWIILKGNEIKKPPLEIVYDEFNRINLQKIKEYYRQTYDEGVECIFEAKLLIVGEPGAGKTSLVRKIENSEYKLTGDEDTTRGIDVTTWYFPRNGDKFRVNIWDFGGQEIYHTTHQFFLTKRSFYALVADTRNEDTDFNYWLNVVELLSDNSPLIIVKNEKQDRHREIDERALKGQFANIKEILATNLKTNRGLSAIIDDVKHHIQRLPLVGNELPKTWVKVRQVLDNDMRDHINLEEYSEICQQNGFKLEKDKMQLSDYLHDLGVCLHFQDDPILRNIIILKPEWGTDAVYQVLDNETVIKNYGHFSRDDLDSIWNEDENKGMREELLRLMINFKLCYQIPGEKDNFIAPQLLTIYKPHYKWNELRNLQLRYTYEFMPKGILTRFIVAMHNYIVDNKLVWRTGVILEKDDAMAEIIENYSKKEIRIRISGKFKRDLMTLVMNEIDDIHDKFHRLKCTKNIPCNCEICKKMAEPCFHPYSDLRRHLKDKQYSIYCKNSYKMVNIYNLIDDVIDIRKMEEEIRSKYGEHLEDLSYHRHRYRSNNEGTTYMANNIIIFGDGASVEAPITIADTIRDSFITIQHLETNPQVKVLLEDLLKQITEVGNKLPSDKTEDAESLAEDAKILIDEMNRSQPREKRLMRALRDIGDTASSIGKIAGPVITIIDKLKPLFSTE